MLYGELSSIDLIVNAFNDNAPAGKHVNILFASYWSEAMNSHVSRHYLVLLKDSSELLMVNDYTKTNYLSWSPAPIAWTLLARLSKDNSSGAGFGGLLCDRYTEHCQHSVVAYNAIQRLISYHVTARSCDNLITDGLSLVPDDPEQVLSTIFNIVTGKLTN